jgi:hypothetical protein
MKFKGFVQFRQEFRLKANLQQAARKSRQTITIMTLKSPAANTNIAASRSRIERHAITFK